MTDPAAILATYSDLKFIRTRKCVQIILEAPIEYAPKIIAAFGTPNPAEETWVAIARMDKAKIAEQPVARPESAEKVKSAGETAKAHFEASCQDDEFITWISDYWHEIRGPERQWPGEREAAKHCCGVESANEFLEHPEKWNVVYEEFKYRETVR